MNSNDRDDLIAKTLEWTFSAANTIEAAGGDSRSVLKLFPVPLLSVLVSNDIHLEYRKPSVKKNDRHESPEPAALPSSEPEKSKTKAEKVDKEKPAEKIVEKPKTGMNILDEEDEEEYED